jgi:hypothetical protein
MPDDHDFPYIDINDGETVPSNEIVPIEQSPAVDDTSPRVQAPSFPPRDPPNPPRPSGGVLFTPENDPLLTPLTHQLPVSPSARGQGVPNRLRHLVSEPPQRSFRDPSGRSRPKDRY